MKKYKITQQGKSNGNIIESPFTVTVTGILKGTPAKGRMEDEMNIFVCTCNSHGIDCANDDLTPSDLKFVLQPITDNDEEQLKNTLEVVLENKYPGNWSVEV